MEAVVDSRRVLAVVVVDNPHIPVVVVAVGRLHVGEAVGCWGMAAAHHLQGAPCEDDGDRLCGCRGTRGSLSGCLFQAPILACRSRSCQSDRWDLLSLVSAVPKKYMLDVLRGGGFAMGGGGGGSGEECLSLSRRPMFVVVCCCDRGEVVVMECGWQGSVV
jgi:hypothetical protein